MTRPDTSSVIPQLRAHACARRAPIANDTSVSVMRQDRDSRPQVLIPFDRREELTPEQAAKIAGRKPRTIRLWCEVHNIGRKVGGGLRVSRVALAMFLDGDEDGLQAYLAGDRSRPRV